MSSKISVANSAVSGEDSVVPVTSRPLFVVAVIDLLQKDGLSLRQMVWSELQSLVHSMNLELQLILFEKLDLGETDTLDAFYGADVAFVDMSIGLQQTTLCYHLGVRESMNQNYNLILYAYDECCRDRVPLQIKIPQNDYKTLLYALVDNAVVAWLCNQVVFGVPCVGNTPAANVIPQKMNSTFREQAKLLLKDVQVDASKHSKEKFLSDLRLARQNSNDEQYCNLLDKLRCRLDDPDVLSVDTVLSMLLSCRDAQKYSTMVSLVEDVSSLPQVKICESPAVQFNYAFALNRRNHGEDRKKALKVVLNMLEKQENQIPDFLCLAGRIYKDRLCESKYTDVEALEEAIKWYRKGFEIQPNEYAGINLATLLVVGGESFKTSNELQRIAMALGGLLGRKGSIANLKDYWDVATLFEISVLAENYSNACQAASRMFQLKPPSWFLKTTIGNMKLIKWYRESSRVETEATSHYHQFLFWVEFFVEYTQSKPLTFVNRFPVLSMEPNKAYTPSYVSVNEANESISLWHVEDPSIKATIKQWVFPADSIRAISASKSDERAVYLYVYLNSDDFTLFFPTDFHRQRFLKLASKVTSTDEGNKLLNDYNDSEQISYAFELDKDGNKIVLGKGKFGTVYSARDLNRQRGVAVKEIEIANSEGIQPLMEEIQFHSTLTHQNIVQYLGCEVAGDGKLFRIVMELVPGGSLSILLRNKWGPLIDNQGTIGYYANQILDGLVYLHGQKIVHGDVKGDNVLVNTYSGQCKLADFGTCKRLAALKPNSDAVIVTQQYVAPEVVDEGQRGYGTPADIWSFGCTIIEMALGKLPFYDIETHEAAAVFDQDLLKVHPPIPEKMSKQAKRLLERCFEPDPNRRPSAAILTLDAFFEKYRRRHVKESNDATVDPGRYLVRSISCMSDVESNDNQKSKGMSSSLHSLNELTEISSAASDTGTQETVVSGSRLFVLRKETEKRDIIFGLMTEYETEILELWLSAVQPVLAPSIATQEFLRALIVGLRQFVIDKDLKKIQDSTNTLVKMLENDASAPSQVHLAFYAFQEVMHKVLKREHIKPHWMFALDRIIRTSIQSFTDALFPALSSENASKPEEDEEEKEEEESESSSNYSSVGSVDANTVRSSYTFADVRPLLNSVNELRVELTDYFVSNRQNFEQVRCTLSACRSLIEAFSGAFLSNAANGMRKVVAQKGYQDVSGVADTRLVKWMDEHKFDERTIGLLLDEEYTLDHLLDMISSREELLTLGIKGGTSCRLWQLIQAHREASRADKVP